jgi:hypothetical protein
VEYVACAGVSRADPRAARGESRVLMRKDDIQTSSLPQARVALRCLVAISLLLAAIGAAGQLVLYLSHPGKTLQVVISRFDLNGEGTIPSWYSTVLLFSAAALLWLVSRRDQKGLGRHWLVLAVIFVLLSLDECASLHERTIKPLRDKLHTSGVFYFAWIIPAMAMVATLGIAYLPFLRRLPRKTQRLFVAAAVLYLMGAVGMEMVSGVWVQQHDEANLTAAMLAVPEELLEMIGVSVFIYALLHYQSTGDR